MRLKFFLVLVTWSMLAAHADLPQNPLTDEGETPEGTRYLDVYPLDLRRSCSKLVGQMTSPSSSGGNFVEFAQAGNPYLILSYNSRMQLRSLEEIKKGQELGEWGNTFALHAVHGATVHGKTGWVAVGYERAQVELFRIGHPDKQVVNGASALRQKAEIRQLAFDPSGTLLATASYASDGALHRFDSGKWKTLVNFDLGNTPSSIEFSPDGEWLIAATRSQDFFFYSVSSLLKRKAGGIAQPKYQLRLPDSIKGYPVSHFFRDATQWVLNGSHRSGENFALFDLVKGRWSEPTAGRALGAIPRGRRRTSELVISIGEGRDHELWTWDDDKKAKILSSQQLDIALPFSIPPITGAPVHGNLRNHSLQAVFPTTVSSTRDGSYLVTGDNAGVLRIFERTRSGYEEKASLALFPRYARGTRMFNEMKIVQRLWNYKDRVFFAVSAENEVVRIDLDDLLP